MGRSMPRKHRENEKASTPARNLHGKCRFKALDKIADKVGEFVDRLRQLQERVWSFLIDAAHPRGNGRLCDQKLFRCLFDRPAPGGSELKDRHSLLRAIARALLRWNLRHSRIPDAHFLAEQCILFPQPLIF